MTRALLEACRHRIANDDMALGRELSPVLAEIDAALVEPDDDGRSVVAMIDMAEGNESVGTAWTECAIFRPDAKVSEVLDWAKDALFLHGKSQPKTNIVIRYAQERQAK